LLREDLLNKNKSEFKACRLFFENSLISTEEEIELRAKIKIFHQKVIFEEELKGEIPYHVLAIVPSKEVKDMKIRMNKKMARVQGEMVITDDMIEFDVCLVPLGNFYVRLYKQPIPMNKTNTRPPKNFKPRIEDRNRDAL